MQGHILIGPPGSGKTTIARKLGPIIKAEIISSDLIRKEIYGEEKIQGNWEEINKLIQNHVLNCIKKRRNFIIDSTNVKRSWRLNYTQNLTACKEIEWIGWWFNTPKEKCFQWNKKRSRQVEENLIGQYWDLLNDKVFGPSISEGFKDLKIIDPSHIELSEKFLETEINKINISAIGRQKHYLSKYEFHDYSALVDFERLMYLIKFLSLNNFNGDNNEYLIANAEKYINQNFGSCYSDHLKIKNDLNWLWQNQFFFNGEDKPIFVLNKNLNSFNTGGWPYTANKERFVQCMSLLRHILHNPFDYSSGDESIYHSLLSKLTSIYTPRETRKIKEDCEKVLRPYFFQDQNTKYKNGYCIGNSILNKKQLKDLWIYIDQVSKKLGDTNAQLMNDLFYRNLKWGGILPNNNNPIRIFANHTIIHEKYTNQYSIARTKKKIVK